MIRKCLKSTGVNSETVQLFGLADREIQVLGLPDCDLGPHNIVIFIFILYI